MEKNNAKGNVKTRQDIGLIFNTLNLPGSCGLCGVRIEGDEDLQFVIENNETGWVCDDCVKKHAPIMIQVKKEVGDYSHFMDLHIKREIRDAVQSAIDESVEKRIMRTLDESCKDYGVCPF